MPQPEEATEESATFVKTHFRNLLLEVGKCRVQYL